MSSQVTVGLVTDSTADIPGEFLGSLAIESIPALLIIDGETFEDGKQLSRSDFYRGLPDYRQPPTTATPSPAQFSAAYKRLLDRGMTHILSIHVASTLSGMLTAAAQAAQEFQGQVEVFDSGQISLGLGFQVIAAAEAAQKGNDISAVLEIAEQAREQVRVLALMNTLEYLRRSGRVSWLQAGMGELLKIKALLSVEHGMVKDQGKARTFQRALGQLQTMATAWGPCDRMAVLHTGVPDLAADLAQEIVPQSKNDPFIVEVTTIIGAHVGPGAIGLAGLTT
jgi:DegV family protein with EDD domain